jgi:flagellar protein FliT
VSAISQLYQLTLDLIQLFESDQDRDGKIEKIESLLSQREELLKQMVPPYSNEEKQIGKNIIQLDSKLSDLLLAEKISIQKDIKALQSKKESNFKYVNPYQSLATDGVFYDKRK